jgi:hypothetical protein
MESTALAILLVTLIHAHNGPLVVRPNHATDPARGQAGRAVLANRFHKPPPRSVDPRAVGLRREYRDGTPVWLGRCPDGKMQIGLGLRTAF